MSNNFTDQRERSSLAAAVFSIRVVNGDETPAGGDGICKTTDTLGRDPKQTICV